MQSPFTGLTGIFSHDAPATTSLNTWSSIINGQVGERGFTDPAKAVEALAQAQPHLPDRNASLTEAAQQAVAISFPNMRALMELVGSHLHYGDEWVVLFSFDRPTATLRVFGLGIDLSCPCIVRDPQTPQTENS
jgi:hypothetical protein